MEKQAPPSFPFYPKDWICSETVERLHESNPRAVSCYIFLLCKAWLSDPPQTLPNDHSTLAKWARVSEKEWQESIWPALKHQFALNGNNRLYNKKQTFIAAKQQIYLRNGKQGGRPKKANLKTKQVTESENQTGYGIS